MYATNKQTAQEVFYFRFSLYWSTWWKTTKRIHKKSLSSNQICTNLKLYGFFLQLWLIWIWSQTRKSVCLFMRACVCTCVCVCAYVCSLYLWNRVRCCFLLGGKLNATLRQARLCMHTDTHRRAHTHTPVFDILQYRGWGGQNTLSPLVRTHIASWRRRVCWGKSQSQQFPRTFNSRTLRFSQNHCTDRHRLWF